ncbi:HNH endonuclease signature motif containing protein [Streptomyces sp. NPDC047070]|uniref:HNH endonuclease n=1 Tax=Streptomyces sp. NPDC047070 TaxID=3154923 RepID=UPI0034527042
MSNRVQYTRERLAQAAEQCSDIDEVITFFGTKPYGKLGLHLYRRFEHFEIDISHFPRRRRRGSHDLPSESELRQAVAQSISIAGVLRALKRPDNSRLRTLLPRLTDEYGIDTSHFLGQAHQRGKPGPTPLKRPEDLLVKHSGGRRTRTSLLRRALLESGVPEECAECGTGPEWLGDPMTLEIDHISGDWADDRAENLRLLCPNCHSVTSTWCRGGRRRHP